MSDNSLKKQGENFNEKSTHKNKQIIIDGVDVSTCLHCNSERNCNAFYLENEDTSVDCNNYPNCYFKQLARKTQECEKKSWEIGNLGYKIKNQRKEINESLKQLKAKEQECDELNEKIEQIEIETEKFLNGDYCNENCKSLKSLNQKRDKLKAENKELKSHIKEWSDYINKVRSWITEAAKNLELEPTHSFGPEHFTFAVRCLKEKYTKILDENVRYKQALAKIAEYTKAQLDANGNDVYSMSKSAIYKILNIINEVKNAR